MILVTGATGHLGKATIEHLLKHTPADNIAAFVRDENKAAFLKEKGVDIRIGNFKDTSSIEKAMNGIEKVFLISSSDHDNIYQQHKNVVDAAKKASVKHLVYTGMAIRNPTTSSLKMMMDTLFGTEDYIKESNLTYTILRNTLYADVVPFYVGEAVFENGVIYIPAENGKTPYAIRREMGEAAANVLLQSGHENKTYEITGSELYSYEDIAKILSELSGKNVSYISPAPEDYTDKLKQAGVPEMGIAILSGFIADQRDGQYQITTDNLQTLLGREPMTLRESLKEIYNF